MFYIHGEKLSFDVLTELNANKVIIDSYENIIDGLEFAAKFGKVVVDPKTASYAIYKYEIHYFILI